MSNFRLEIDYPTINYDWYKKNTDGTPKCPVNWKFYGADNIERYIEQSNGWVLNMYEGESTSIPIETNEIEFNTHTVQIQNIGYHEGVGEIDYDVEFWFNDTDFQTVTYTTGSLETTTLTLPEGVTYLRIESTTPDVYITLYVDIQFSFYTSWIDINTELSDFSTANNNRVSTTVDDTLIVTSLAKRDVFYANNLIMSNEERKEMDSLVDLAILNNLLVLVVIDAVELGGNSLGGLPTTAIENYITYYFKGHSSTQKTGLYEYVNLQYKNDVDNSYII